MMEIDKIDIGEQITASEGVSGFDVGRYVKQYPVGQRLLTPEEYECLEESKRRPEPAMGDPKYTQWSMQMIHVNNGGETTWHLNWDPASEMPVYEDGVVPDEVVWAIALLPSPTRKARREEKRRQFRRGQAEREA